ncbi:hypothetical protein OXX80_000018 [Metschnikowia pulcherrima]
MTKKQRSRNKRRGHKKGGRGNNNVNHRGSQNQESPRFEDPFGTDSTEIAAGPGRHSYSDNMARRRQQGSASQAPLTDRNLQTLLEQNDPSFRRQNSVALDMDQYAREQSHFGKHYAPGGVDDNVSIYSQGSRASLEFGQSNPSSDHSSDSTSLDDVCFPDYYEGLRDNGTTESQAWPDLRVLEEYISEEQEDLQEHMAEVPSGVNFQFPVARKVSSQENTKMAAKTAQDSATPRYSTDLSPTTEESPLLNSVHVDESQSVRSGGSSLRVRPKPIQPWEKSRETVPILANKKGDAAYRFTFFREDIDGTIHAPTLSGLVTDREQPHMSDEQIQQKLRFLFAPDGASSVPKHADGIDTPILKTHSRTVSQKFDSPLPSSELHASTSNSVLEEKHVAPFWLDITDPSEEEMKVLSKTFGLHPLTTEDIFLGETREKVELFRQYYFICFTSFDIVYERRKQRAREHEKKLTKLMELDSDGGSTQQKKSGILRRVKRLFGDGSRGKCSSKMSVGQSTVSKNNRIRSGELCPLNMYMIIFETGVLTFHFNPTPHPVNVRRRARMLKDHLTVSTDWICYALIDDITDSFAPMIDSIEQEVYNIEDEIMRMHSGDSTDSESDDDESDSEHDFLVESRSKKHANDVFYRRQRSKSVVDAPQTQQFLRSRGKRGSGAEYVSLRSERSGRSKSTISSSSKSTSSKIVAWKRKGDMLRRIGECRKRVMSVMRLLGTKADVIKGFSKRFSENEVMSSPRGPHGQKSNRLASKQEILMYLGDIQDHIVTMVQSLNHYEKLLARSHSNYLAQLNIDMTKVNNDTNDILGKVTILGTIVLPINVVTGLWGMNCIVPGQDHEGLTWFNGIVVAISVFSILSYLYARKVTGL